MPLTVKKIVLWRTEVDNKPGTLACTLEPLAKAGADLRLGMGYRQPGSEGKAAIEIYPVAGKKQIAAAQAGGLSASTIPALLVEGANQSGLGYAVASAVAQAGVNLTFFVAQVVGKTCSAVLGLETEEDARKAAAAIKKALATKKRAR
jgi:hypothetical protein